MPTCWTQIWAVLSMQLTLFFISDMITEKCYACVEDTQECIQTDDLFQLVVKPETFCEAGGERKSPIGPLQTRGILGWLQRKTDSWKKSMLLMKKDVLDM